MATALIIQRQSDAPAASNDAQAGGIVRTTRGAIPNGAKGAAAYIGCGVTKLYDLVGQRLLVPVKIGTRTVFMYDAVDAALEKLVKREAA